MSKQPADIHNPSVTIQISSRSVTVKELTWKQHFRAIRELTDTIMGLVDTSGGGKPAGGISISFDRQKLIDALASQEEFMNWILTAATDLKPEEADVLNASDFLKIISTIVDMNLGEEVIGTVKKLGAKMSAVFGLTAN